MEGGTRGAGGGHGPPKILENPYTHTLPPPEENFLVQGFDVDDDE